ncbi:MAG: CinA family protein [Nitrospirae bacterium CG_4_10_14_0_8_um_filter_41_23]|nr:MAG: damage-inducible protein CinA [Nitrospirae bacterium CG11_big_fil_rev_8_21_14_0_20_41_14]PIV44830.1 MAG: CinA family protein [Nitrospirae bacterium CG02_land_8_20_14_3_00_41_53]PIW86578.1 MAG: CinA family protein [Nitrospirae bacterium CG_4_8_14_3_um_filter_41_47]PIY86676.1 MAG: CinA family protein [Nitrospirae bacterium CG_4_10_14_0_8_um_filter_41_23]PJA80592.1 MAG: CinA family protein [Nitrospirae bacterium CG_4_9_14_3_um_filter_41_27]
MNKKTLEVIERVHEIFKEKGLTLSAAESCTGGLISHLLTILPGASTFFNGGLVAYSIEFKKKILGVSSKTISRHGVVSKETAREMAEKIRALAKTDFSLSTTGNLGPDVLEDKEKGLIYTAVSKEGKTFSRELRLKGNREQNKEEASLIALRFLIEIVEG